MENDFLSVLILLLTGNFITSVVSLFLAFRKRKENDVDRLIGLLERENEKLRSDMDKKEAVIEALRELHN